MDKDAAEKGSFELHGGKPITLASIISVGIITAYQGRFHYEIRTDCGYPETVSLPSSDAITAHRASLLKALRSQP